MPRQGRQNSNSGIYHAMVRGINRQKIFHDDEDRQYYLKVLDRVRVKSGCEVYGYCLMNNHVHLLIKEQAEEISQVMKRLGVSFAYWYNLKHGRTGHVFQDRFKSEPIEDDSYFLAVLRYIHQNPLKAGVVDNIFDYPWSSYKAYLFHGQTFVNTKFALQILGGEEQYRQYMNQITDGEVLEEHKKLKCSDETIKAELVKILQGMPVQALTESKQKRDEVLRQLKSIEGASIRQIARVTMLGRNVVARA